VDDAQLAGGGRPGAQALISIAGSEKAMRQLFAVIRTRGPAWQAARPLEGQADWAGHAAFMNALARDGFVVLGGPLEGTPDVLLIVRAATPDEVRSRLAEDPWTASDLLQVANVTPWTLRLGTLDPAGRPAARGASP
jgi:uncharacterized protein YciI